MLDFKLSRSLFHPLTPILLLLAALFLFLSPIVGQDQEQVLVEPEPEPEPVPDTEAQTRMDDWYNTTAHPHYDCSPDELEYLKSCHPWTSDEYDLDDYYEFNGTNDVHPKAGETPCNRREIRALSRQEFGRFAEAMNAWERTNGRRLFCILHRNANAPGAHFGPCFCTWHREYLSRVETDLKRRVPGVCHPYYDSSLDAWMASPCDSVIYSPDYYGNPNGPVTTGFCANWPNYPANECGPRLVRACVSGNAGRSRLYSSNYIANLLGSYSSYGDICYPLNQGFESAHGAVHTYIGGTMNSLSCAANDPLFWAHHTMVDYLFQMCRDRQRTNVVTDYPTWQQNPQWTRNNDPMRPFHDLQLRCIDGLSINYDRWYTYVPYQQACTPPTDQCGGVGLWCHPVLRRCCSKVRIGGASCAGYDEACYTDSTCRGTARCMGGTCVCV